MAVLRFVMPDVWFIRHGECTANVGGATYSAREAQLTSRGLCQARYVADYLHYNIDPQRMRIITSSYVRALETANFTHDMFPEAPFEVWPLMGEFDYLSLPVNVPTTSSQRAPMVRDFWKRSDPFFAHKHAESFDGFIARLREALKRLCELGEDRLIVVFSHYQFIQAIRWLLGDGVKGAHPHPDEMQDFYRYLKAIALPNGAIVQARLGAEKSLVRFCKTAHLANDRPPVTAASSPRLLDDRQGGQR